jgi:hypothetical protein
VQHIIGMPLQLIIIGMLQSFIIFIISMQQLFIISMLMPAIGIILQVMPSLIRVHSIMHLTIGISMPFMGIAIIGMLMAFMPIIMRLPHCIIIGMPQFIIICIICALLRNIAMSISAAGFMVQSMPSSTIWQVMVAIIIGMPVIAIIGIAAFMFIGICIAFIMVKSLFKVTRGMCSMRRF